MTASPVEHLSYARAMFASLRSLPEEEVQQVDYRKLPRMDYTKVMRTMTQHAKETDRTMSSKKLKRIIARKLGIISHLLWLSLFDHEDACRRALLDAGASINLISSKHLHTVPS